MATYSKIMLKKTQTGLLNLTMSLVHSKSLHIHHLNQVRTFDM